MGRFGAAPADARVPGRARMCRVHDRLPPMHPPTPGYCQMAWRVRVAGAPDARASSYRHGGVTAGHGTGGPVTGVFPPHRLSISASSTQPSTPQGATATTTGRLGQQAAPPNAAYAGQACISRIRSGPLATQGVRVDAHGYPDFSPYARAAAEIAEPPEGFGVDELRLTDYVSVNAALATAGHDLRTRFRPWPLRMAGPDDVRHTADGNSSPWRSRRCCGIARRHRRRRPSITASGGRVRWHTCGPRTSGCRSRRSR